LKIGFGIIRISATGADFVRTTIEAVNGKGYKDYTEAQINFKYAACLHCMRSLERVADLLKFFNIDRHISTLVASLLIFIPMLNAEGAIRAAVRAPWNVLESNQSFV
jgi:hypothetical protein